MDLAKAFGTVDHDLLLEILFKLGIFKQTTSWGGI